MLLEIVLLVVGVLGVWLSSEIVIYASQIVAQKLKISESFIGLTILSIGTTLPELGTHIMSSVAILQGKNLSDIAISTNIGSNIVQITAILGIVALFISVKAKKEFLDKDYVVMLGAIMLLFILGFDGKYDRIDGFFLVMLYIVYLAYLGKSEHFVDKVENGYTKKKVALYTLAIPVGIVLLLGTAHLAITNADKIASLLGVKDSLIGALVLGIGTALPELAAAIVAIKRGSTEMSIGVLVGSNITNPLWGIGIGSLISTYTVSQSILWLDLPAWFFVSIIALLFFWRKLHMEKKEAILLLICYMAYVGIKLQFGI